MNLFDERDEGDPKDNENLNKRIEFKIQSRKKAIVIAVLGLVMIFAFSFGGAFLANQLLTNRINMANKLLTNSINKELRDFKSSLPAASDLSDIEIPHCQDSCRF